MIQNETRFKSDYFVIISVRKWKKKSTLGGAGKWEFEVGEQLGPRMLESEGLMESNTNVRMVFHSLTNKMKFINRNEYQILFNRFCSFF